jgi:hypothetical protein
MEKKIYPDYSVTKIDNNNIKLNTFIRKEYNGVWYLWGVEKTFNIDEKEGDVIRLFNTECYKVIILGILNDSNINCENYAHVPIFKKDDNQQSERERLIYEK